MKTRHITICNEKGGVGKTTTAVSLGHGLALRGKRVLLVDCDPQGQVATFLGLRQEPCLFDLLVGGRPLSDVLRSADANGNERPGLQILPGNKRTAVAQVVLAVEGDKLTCLADALKPKKGVDYVIFDTSPSVGLLQEAALWASDWLLIPCAVDYAATEGVRGVMTTLKALKDKGAKCQLLGVLPTFFDSLTRESQSIMRQLKYHLQEAIWQPIHRATILREATSHGQTIFELAPESRAAKQYGELTEKVLGYG